jgi:hypothetical protein
MDDKKKPHLDMVFVGGPLHRIRCRMTWCPQVNFFMDESNKQAHAYVREEMTYFYDPELSKRMSDKYNLLSALGKPNRIEPLEEVKKKELD